LRPVSKKRAKINRKAREVRKELCEVAGECDLCQVPAIDLCGHEIPRAGVRVFAFDKPYAVLILCYGCHKFVHENEGTIWTKTRQAALLKIRRPEAWNLPALNGLLIRKLDEDEIEIAERDLRNPEKYELRLRQHWARVAREGKRA
jgi:hypothetical protein